MWPFSERGPRIDIEEALQKHQANFDFAPFAKNDASIKLWLPEKLTKSVDVLSVEHVVSRPDVLRWIFFEHAYGREMFAGLQKYQRQLLEAQMAAEAARREEAEKKVGETEVSYRRAEIETERDVNQRFLGKSTEDVKLWLPTPLKLALQELSVGNKQKLSDYLRAVLVRHIYGERFYSEWQQALAVINKRAVKHEE